MLSITNGVEIYLKIQYAFRSICMESEQENDDDDDGSSYEVWTKA